MHGQACIFGANLTPFSLQRAAEERTRQVYGLAKVCARLPAPPAMAALIAVQLYSCTKWLCKYLRWYYSVDCTRL
jgi:hypothetical protein